MSGISEPTPLPTICIEVMNEHIETSQSICIVNQFSGIFMTERLSRQWVKTKNELSLVKLLITQLTIICSKSSVETKKKV